MVPGDNAFLDALEELAEALDRVERCLAAPHTAPGGHPDTAEIGIEARENRVMASAHGVLAVQASRELREEMAALRAQAQQMARQARAVRERTRTRHRGRATTAPEGSPIANGASSPGPAVVGTGTGTAGEVAPEREPDRAVDRAVAFIEAHAGEDISAGDIAGAAGVSQRRLQEAFRAARGMPPTGHLRAVRLERAHAELAEADPDGGQTVAAVAARWGFAHAGRFAGAYRAAYGRHPSRTLYAPPPRVAGGLSAVSAEAE